MSGPNPFDAIASGGQHNPFTAIAQGTPEPSSSLDVASRVASAYGMPTDIPFAVRHPWISSLLVEPIQKIATGAETAWRDMSDRWYRQSPYYSPPPAKPGPVDMTQPVRTPDYYESYGEWLTRRSAEGDEDATRKINDSLEGAALLGSFLGPSVLKFAWPTRALGPVAETGLRGAVSRAWMYGARGTLGRAGSYLTGEFLGGSIYGAIAPREGEGRLSEALAQGATFAAFGAGIGGALHGGSWLIRRAISRLPATQRTAIVEGVDRELSALDRTMGEHGGSVTGLDPRQQDQIVEDLYHQEAARVLKSQSAVDRLVQEATQGLKAPGGIPEALPDIMPHRPPLRRDEMILSEEWRGVETSRGRPRVEPVPQVEGLVQGPGAPTRAVAGPWSGVVDLRDGAVERTFTQAQAKAVDYHHNMLISPEENEAIKSGEKAYFWMDEDGVPRTMEGPLSSSIRARVAAQMPSPTVQAASDIAASFEPHELIPAEPAPAGMQPGAPPPALRSYVRYEYKPGGKYEPVEVGKPSGGIEETKFQPTALESQGETALGPEGTGAPAQIRQLAMMDMAIKEAVRRIEPLEIATLDVRSAADEVKRMASLKTLDTGLKPEEIDLNNPSSLTGAVGDRFEQGELIEAPWLRPAEPGYAPVARPSADVMAAMEKLSDDELFAMMERDRPRTEAELSAPLDEAAIARRAKELEGRFGKPNPERGALSSQLLVRGAIGLTGAAVETQGFNENLPPWMRNTAIVFGGMMMLSAIHPAVGAWMRSSKIGRRLLEQANPLALITDPKSKEALTRLVETRTYGRALAQSHKQMLERIFDTPDSRRAVMYALDEMDPANGKFPAEYHNLTPEQQRAALALNQMNLGLGQLLQRAGILDEYKQNYVRHLLPPEAFSKWKRTGFKMFSTSGGFAEKRQIEDLRGLEEWAAKEGLPGPITDITVAHPVHIEEAYRAMGNAGLWNMLEKLGVLQHVERGVPVPEGNRVINILNRAGWHAPQGVAAALENLSTPGRSSSEVFNAMDAIKGKAVRAIMFWFWEHGLNAMRAAVLLTSNPLKYGDFITALKDADAIKLEGAKYGLNVTSRPDYGVAAGGRLEKVLEAIKSNAAFGPIVRAGGRLIEKQDKLLWDHIIPSLQVVAYATRMNDWAERTEGKFAMGSAEYVRAARAAAGFANTVAGRIPTELANPRFMQFMRQLMFSPQWTTSRIALTTNAAGEISDILAGKVDAGHPAYLAMKMRQVAATAAITYAGSRILSGKDPQYNPNTYKFYMRTGSRSPSGHDIGVDLLGWWQDDLKLLGHPIQYAAGRLNPVFNIAVMAKTGRDYYGRKMTFPQEVAQVGRSLGPIPAAGTLIARLMQGAARGGMAGPTNGEILQLGLKALGTGNVSALPRPMDAMFAQYSKRLLNNSKIPANDDNIFELSRLLRANFLSQRPIIDNRVVNYIAYRRRQSGLDPLGTKFDNLWESARHVIAEW